ncbi:hypothetical protein NB644_03735 [Oxalobacter formigenes]|uniref:hypothetical protein n=1 Tax=Oxalobacter formigenes TaxID=847 RepID=UPI001E5C3112|nr:hypothetical protein [Oxalobacter formigenes]MCZ4061933.1 hypothetical protein [Oxalobacter formigenes]WAW02165.1 hypothetical protein NB644_03735 [Oxalobacter formigenes]WAW04500.1 hypothetical protein NB642_04540 [Oxalobacter formigenes]WAW05087.1 hypothetical protein NB639_07045 [Oxalobacter formigenes]
MNLSMLTVGIRCSGYRMRLCKRRSRNGQKNNIENHPFFYIRKMMFEAVKTAFHSISQATFSSVAFFSEKYQQEF